jgi:putative membrane protein
MVSYNPKEWFSFIFRFHKADTFRQLLWLIAAICAYAWLIAYLEESVFRISETSHLRSISLLHGLLGFVISLLLVFRTNTAYDRWWEGRKLWGALVNNSRNLAIKLYAILGREDEENCSFFRNIIPAYAAALRDHLRNDITRIELFDNKPDLADQIDHLKHVPNQLAGMMMTKVMELHRAGRITGDQLIVLNAELQSFTEICGACERIKNTPIPFSYTVFIKKFIFFYVISLPLGYVFSMGYLVVPVTGFVFYVLASLELIAEEIEDPFGKDANDLPTTKMAHNIQVHIHELL